MTSKDTAQAFSALLDMSASPPPPPPHRRHIALRAVHCTSLGRLFFPLFLLTLVSIRMAAPQLALADERTSKKLRIGVIAPLSGAVAVWGKSVQHAIELANSESDNPAEIFFEDEESCSATKALSAFHSLVNQRGIDVIVASCLSGGRAIAPLAQAKHLPMFISGRSSREFQNSHPNSLSWLSLLNYEGDYIGQLIKERGWRKGTALVSSDYFGQQFAQGINDALGTQKVAFDLKLREFGLDSQPVGSDLIATLRDKPEVVILMLGESTAAFVVKQLRTMRYSGAVVLQSSMLQTYDQSTRRPFSGAFQLKFDINQRQFSRVRERIVVLLGPDVADDFVFSYDGFRALLHETRTCQNESLSPLDECVSRRMRSEVWREGASGRFRFMRDGSTERPMRLQIVTETGFDNMASK